MKNKFKYKEIEVDELLSVFFTEKQKNLISKKLHKIRLTKSERAIYSRSIKKKILAIANSHLHRLAQTIYNF